MKTRAAAPVGTAVPSRPRATRVALLGRPGQPALPGNSLLVGVSGGRDSVALLHALAMAGGRELVACHLDHSLRAESAEDAVFVKKFAHVLRVECVTAREDVRARAKRTRRSLETAARDARHEFFHRVAAERGIPHLALAHHADDQVETFLFNLLRGAGPGGLGAMRPVSTHGTLEIHRPLLGVWREEIDAYIAQHALAFHEDASNTDPRHTRNRLRHEIVPMLGAAFGRDVRHAIWRAAELCSAEHEFLNGLLIESDTAPALDVPALRALPPAVQRRILHAWLRANGIHQVAFDDVENVRALLDGPRAKVNLPGARHARRRAGRLFSRSLPRRRERGRFRLPGVSTVLIPAAMFLALTQLQEFAVECATVPVLFILLVTGGRRLKRKYGVRLGVVYVLFSIAFSIYLPLRILTSMGRVGPMDTMAGSLEEISQLLFAAVVLFGTMVFIALLRRFFWEIWFEKKAHTHAPKFLSQLVGLLIFITAVLLVLTFDYHKDISVLLGASGLAAIVLGLALQDLLGNVIAGIALELGKPFTPGDWLVIDGKHAEVIEVNWRSTRLRDNDDIYLDIPNKHIVGSTITNLTHPNRQHGIRLHVGFDYSTPPNLVKDALKRAAVNAANVLPTPPPKVFLKEFADSAILYEIRFWMEDESKYNDTLDGIRTNVWYEAQRSGLKIPFPIRTIQIERPKAAVRDKLEVARTSMQRQSFLQLLAPSQLDRLLNDARFLRYGRNERIIEQGAEGRSMFILVHGEAEVLVKINGAENSVAVLRDGDYCGEMSLLTGEPRSASVVAKTDCEMWEIGKDMLAAILTENQPLVEKLSEILATRKLEMEGIVAHAMAADDVKAKQQEYKAGFLKRLYGFFEL